MVYTSGRFFLSHDLLFVSVFFSPFSIVITSLGEERAGLCATHAFVWLLRTRQCLSFFFSFSWYQGLAAACDCGTPWTFLSCILARMLSSVSSCVSTKTNPVRRQAWPPSVILDFSCYRISPETTVQI